MEADVSVGIGDIAVYIPRQEMDLDRLVAARTRADPGLGLHLERARRTTGQLSIRFPRSWEDTATMASEAVKELYSRSGASLPRTLRYLAVGTETGLDHSKPVSSYVQGMLGCAGLRVPATMTNFQLQHACAAGTISLLGVAGLLALSRDPSDTGIVVAADIARYEQATTAEITQGAGAAALLVERNPRLLELDVAGAGYCSMPVDDFFRPLGSFTARVKGQYSIQCYVRSFEEAFADHARRAGKSPAELLGSTDYFVLHAPFRNMPEVAMQRLLATAVGLDKDQARAFLDEHSFGDGVNPVAAIGNTYAASLYVGLACMLEAQLYRIGQGIIGKRIMLASYGSGNTMVVLSATVAREAPAVIASWGLARKLGSSDEASITEYQEWMERSHYGSPTVEGSVPEGSFYLSGIREDGYREYGYRRSAAEKQGEHPGTESQASRNLHGSGALQG